MKTIIHRRQTSLVGALVGLAFGASAHAQNVNTKPDALLQIDLNRNAVVDRILSAWKDDVPRRQMESFREKLTGLRADQLLAANVSGSFEGVLEIVSSHEKTAMSAGARALANLASEHANMTSLKPTAERAKVLGDPLAELVYTPVTPCRFIDTRGVFSPQFAGGAYAPSETRSYQATTRCGVPSGAAAVVTQITVITPTAAGDIEVLPQGGTFGNTAAMVFQAGVYSSVSMVARLNQTNGSFSTQMRGLGGHVAMDITGYFSAPAAPIGDITSITAGTGLSGTATSGDATLSIAPAYRLPQSCAANQIARWNGTAWLCGTDVKPAAALECQGTPFSTFNLAANSNVYFDNLSCPAGYTALTPYCYASDAGVVSQGSGINNNTSGNSTYCAWQNTTSATRQVFGGTMCCRVPSQ